MTTAASNKIDPSQVKWDEPIDASKVKWDVPVGGHSFDVINGGKVPTGSAEAHAAMSPTSGMSGTDLAMAGAGKSQVDAWHGIRQLFGSQGAQSEIDSAAANDQPLMATTAGKAGYVGGNIADMAALSTVPGVGAIANPATFAGAAASGALQGAIQPVATGDSRLWNTAAGAAGGVVGQGLAKGANAIGAAAAGPLHEAANSAVQALNDAGVPLDAAQRTGSILLQRAKAMLGDNPLTAGAQRDFQAMQQKAVTRALLQTIGETANDANPTVMGQAAKRMGDTYDSLFEKLHLPYDKIEAPLSNIMNEARIPLDDQQFAKLSRVSDDILGKASQNGGIISGPQWQNVKKTLDGLSSSSDTDVASFARDIRQTMHDGLMQHAVDTGNTADAALLKKTNQQWRNMKTLEGAIKPEDGTYQISPSRVASIMGNKANRGTSVYGRGDTSLSNLADAATSLLGEKTNNSGTMSRFLPQAMLAGAAGTGEAIYSGDWKKGAEYGIGAYALPKAIQMGMNAQGPIAQGAMRGLGALSEPTLASGAKGAAQAALQKLPNATLKAIEAGLDKSKKETPATE